MMSNFLVILFLILSTLYYQSCALLRDSNDDTNDVKNYDKHGCQNEGSFERTCSDGTVDCIYSSPKGRDEKQSLLVANRYCFDKYDQCARWVEEERNAPGGNICESNPSFLKVACRLSCGVCTPTYSFPWCQDYNMECGYWASIGECENNVPYMAWNCKRSCNLCPLDPIQRQAQLQHESSAPKMGDYVIIQKIPHISESFTQGLTYNNYTGILYESTGNYGESEIRKIDPNTGQILLSRSMESNYFGEGLTLFDNCTKLIQLTYKENTGFVYDSISLEILQTFQYETTTHEGWGITYDDSTNTLYVSDGSEWISLWHPETRKEQRRMRVTYDGEPLQFLNELEFIHGNHKRILLANVFTTDAIVGINPDTGVVEILYDFTALWPYHDRSHYPHVDVFNGISHTDIANEIIITGKFWPYMYRVKLLV